MKKSTIIIGLIIRLIVSNIVVLNFYSYTGTPIMSDSAAVLLGVISCLVCVIYLLKLIVYKIYGLDNKEETNENSEDDSK